MFLVILFLFCFLFCIFKSNLKNQSEYVLLYVGLTGLQFLSKKQEIVYY